MDKRALAPLPLTHYQYAEWRPVSLGMNYHVQIDEHFYSAPHQLRNDKPSARLTATYVELFHNNKRVASHQRSYKGGDTTLGEHMPKGHREYAEWTPERLVKWASETGEATAQLVDAILSGLVHPQQGFNSCLGIMSLSKKYGCDRVEAASKRAPRHRWHQLQKHEINLGQRSRLQAAVGEARQRAGPASQHPRQQLLPLKGENKMLIHPTIDKLNSMRLAGMAKGLRAQLENPEIHNLPFEDRLALLVDEEGLERESWQPRHAAQGCKTARERCAGRSGHPGSRGLDRTLLASLATCQWIKRHHNLVITGATGAGKTWLACALSHSACRQGMTAAYHRLPALMQDLDLARHDGRYKKMMRAIGRVELLILDDLGLARLSVEQLRDLLETIDERYQKRSTLFTSQLPVANWYEVLGDPTMADAILDRLVHNAYKIELNGVDSMRKLRSKIDAA